MNFMYVMIISLEDKIQGNVIKQDENNRMKGRERIIGSERLQAFYVIARSNTSILGNFWVIYLIK